MTRGPGEHFLRGTRKCSDLRRVCAYGLSGEEAATRKEGRRKVSPDLVDAQMGLGGGFGFCPSEAPARLQAEGGLCSVSCFCESV